MATAAIGAAKWVLGKVVSKLSDHALEAWAATQGLGDNVRTLNKELLYVHSVLKGTQGRDMSGNRELVQLLEKLRELTDEADDMLDELDYFRIQDQLDGTHQAADQPDRGMCCDALFHARHAAVNVVTEWLRCLPAFDGEGRHFLGCASLHGLASAANTVGKSLLCSSCLPAVPDVGAQEPLLPAVPDPVVENLESEAPKLVFDRVGMSQNMERILGELRPMCAQVSDVLKQELWKSNNTTTPPKRPVTTSRILEDKVFGREGIRDKIIAHMIGGDKHVAAKDDLSVFLIFGHGGMGKTTLAQYVYNDERVKKHFDVKVWVCVSHDFDVTRLTREILTGILVYLGEQGNSSLQANLDQLQTQIEKNLESKQLLLVLDDIWQYKDEHGFLSKKIEQAWKQLIAPLRKGPMKGNNAVLVTSRFTSLADEIKVADDCKKELTGLEDEDFRKYFYTCISGDENWKPQEDELKEIGDEIIENLKCSPLAAKTVGRLLGTDLSARHWREVLESKEWGSQKDDHDIMPALKLSFDYLPFHLQECFSFCALFLEDYEFGREELIQLWIGAGIIYSGQNNRVEDIGLKYLKELVDHGFLKRIERKKGPLGKQGLFFVMHDLMHDLAVQVSSHKYLSINSSNIKSTVFSSSVCHLSIFIDGDVKYYDDFRKVFCESKKTLKIENLRTLIFGGYGFVFTNIFRDVFREVKGLRVLHLSDKSDPPESILHNFSKLVHLRYLRLATRLQPSMSLPKALSRFYQLKVLDLLEWEGNPNLPSDMSNLRKLRHFVANKEMHRRILEVGKLKFLQGLKAFNVETRNDSAFDLSQLGELMELRGSLSIHNLEKVKNKEEADNAQLSSKRKLDELKLFWNLEQSNNTAVDELLESLRPHSDLERLHINGHRGTTCPTWLGTNISVKSLESLCLHNVSWETLPPFGEFGIEVSGRTTNQSFRNLKRLELVSMPKLEKWVGGKACHLLSNLEVLIVTNCPKLEELPYSQKSSSSTQDENNNWFPRLQELTISYCPNLSVLPLIPYTSTLCSVAIDEVGSCLNILKYQAKARALSIELKEHLTSDLQSFDKNVLAFHNLIKLEELEVEKCPSLALKYLQMLKSLKRLKIRECKRIILDMDEETNLNCQLPIEHLKIDKCGISGKELSQLLFCLPALSCLRIEGCQGLKRMSVVEEQQHHQVIEEDEGLLRFPSHFSTSLRELEMDDCSNLRLVMVGAAEMAGEGLRSSPNCDEDMTSHCCPVPSSLQNLRLHSEKGIPSLSLSNLTSLTSLKIIYCENLFSPFDEDSWSPNCDEDSWSPNCAEDMTSPCCPFPSSLQYLCLRRVEGIPSSVFSNLTSLTSLEIDTCWIILSGFDSLSPNCDEDMISHCCPFPSSLQELSLEEVEDIPSLALSNLTSLTYLQIPFKEWDEVEQHVLIPFVNLNKWQVWGDYLYGEVLGAWEPPHVLPSSSSQPQPQPQVLHFTTYDLPGFLMSPSLCTRLSSSLQTLVVVDDKVEGFTAEQEQALQLLTSLQYLRFKWCSKLRSLPAGLHRLRNLKRLKIKGCPELWNGVAGLMKLRVENSPKVFSADWAATTVPNSSRLQKIDTDDIAGFLMAPSLCSLLSSSLQTLVFNMDFKLESFTAEQEQALQLLTSLQYLTFKNCMKLQSLPAGLHRLRNLKRLQINNCREIRSLPKDGLPSSLQQLDVHWGVSNELKRECSKLRNIPEIILFDN